MWFKQLQLFQLPDTLQYTSNELSDLLQQIPYQPCLPSMPQSIGWIGVIDEDDAPLVRTVNNCHLFCLQIEEKILPGPVIRQQLSEHIKKLEHEEQRKIRQKEKLALKDEIIMTLLPKSFSKLTRIYAYIDNKNHWLVIGTTNKSKIEQFLSLFKKSISDQVRSFELKKISTIMTYWLKEKNYPTTFAIEKAGVLQDPNQQNRIIRCQQQDLFAGSIQALIKDGCEATHIAMSWHDQVNFVLASDFTLRSIQFHNEIREQSQELEPETLQQQLDADFMIMTAALAGLLLELLELCTKPHEPKHTALPTMAPYDYETHEEIPA